MIPDHDGIIINFHFAVAVNGVKVAGQLDKEKCPICIRIKLLHLYRRNVKAKICPAVKLPS